MSTQILKPETLNLHQASEALNYLIDTDIPTFIWGAPGVGKSSIVGQIAQNRRWGLVDFRLTTRDPVSLMGLPSLKGTTTKWLSPDEYPQVERDGEVGILFLDELNAASPAMQTAAFGLVLERKIGSYTLPPKWRIVAAGNRQSDRAAAQRMPSALANRFAHIYVEPDIETTTKHFSEKGLDPMLIAFLRFRPNLLHLMSDETLHAFPSPRSWEQVAKVLKAPPHLRFSMIASLVGAATATELEAFLQTCHELPTMDEVLNNPLQARICTKPATCYAVTYALVRQTTPSTIANAVAYMKRLSAEYLNLFMTDIQNSNKALTETREYIDWAIKTQDLALVA